MDERVNNLITRRHLFGLLAAPAVVRASSLMPVVLLPLALWEKQAELHRLWYGVYDNTAQRADIAKWMRYSKHPMHHFDCWHMYFLTGQLGGPPAPCRAAAMAYAKRAGLLDPNVLAGSPRLTPESGWPGPYVNGTYHPEVMRRSTGHAERATWIEGVEQRVG